MYPVNNKWTNFQLNLEPIVLGNARDGEASAVEIEESLPTLTQALSDDAWKSELPWNDFEVTSLRINYGGLLEGASDEVEKWTELSQAAQNFHFRLKLFLSGGCPKREFDTIFLSLPPRLRKALGDFVMRSCGSPDMGDPSFGERAILLDPSLLTQIETPELDGMSIDQYVYQSIRADQAKVTLIFLCSLIFTDYRTVRSEEHSLPTMINLLGPEVWGQYREYVCAQITDFPIDADDVVFIEAAQGGVYLFESFLSRFRLGETIYDRIDRLNGIAHVPEEDWNELFQQFPPISVPETVVTSFDMLKFAVEIFKTQAVKSRVSLELPNNPAILTTYIPLALPYTIIDCVHKFFHECGAGLQMVDQVVFTAPPVLPGKVLRIIKKPIMGTPVPYSLDAWHNIVQTVIHNEGLAIEIPSVVRVQPTEYYVAIETAPAEPQPFKTAFLLLPKVVQQRLARDLCRLVQLTGYNIDYRRMQIKDSKILLPPQLSVPVTLRSMVRSTMHVLLELSDAEHEDIPILHNACRIASDEIEDEIFETSGNIHSLRDFIAIMRSEKPIVEKQAAFNKLSQPMRQSLCYALQYGNSVKLTLDQWKQNFLVDPTLLMRLNSKGGLHILEQLEVRMGLYESLKALRLVKRTLLQKDKPNPTAMKILMLTLRETMMGAQLMVLVAKEWAQAKPPFNMSQLAKAFQGQDREGLLRSLDRYIDLLVENKNRLSWASIINRIYSQSLLTFEQFPVRPMSRGQLRLEGESPKSLQVMLVAWECAKFGMKYGGLGEAVYGMAKALSARGYKITVLTPMFTGLPVPLQAKIAQGTTIRSTHHWKEEIRIVAIHKIVEEGIDLLYLDEAVGPKACGYFDVPTEQDLYKDGRLAVPGRKGHGLKEKMIYFGSAVAGFIQLGSAINFNFEAVIFNDWHAAYAIDLLAFNKKEQWVKGKLPANVFVIHNNSYGCQGVYGEEDVDILQSAGDQRKGLNVMQQAIQAADASLTVSESFAYEMQDVASGLGAGLTPWVREAAAQGKFHGITNGSNPELWNPSTDRNLTEWRDPQDLSTPIDLSFSAQSENIAAKKRVIRTQLFKALQRYYPEAVTALGCATVEEFLAKPLMVYVGRYDSSQKGLDKFEPILEVAHRKGALLITMGVGEDPQAKYILDQLQARAAKYRCAWVTRGDAVESSRAMQKGDPARGIPPLGSLIRGAADLFVLPSSFEPCGLVQFEAWLYAALVIGTKTGGLADTIDADESSPSFNGFTFDRLREWESAEQHQLVEATVCHAIDFLRGLSEEQRNAMMSRVMVRAGQSSWTSAAQGPAPVDRYSQAIQMAIQAKRKRGVQPIDLLGIELTPAPARTDFFGQNPKPDLHLRFGAHIETAGVRFRVMAPAAKDVKLVLVGKDGNETLHELIQLSDGSWEALIAEAEEGSVYEYEIVNAQGEITRKIDPFAYGFQMRPDYRCVVTRSKPTFLWTDHNWLDARKAFISKDAPVNIYEAHLGSIKRKKDGSFLNYRELAVHLGEHCKKMHYTHVELVGLFEHDADESMGYQVKGFFAPTSRHGSLEDFQYFVNYLHKEKIGVVLDFVPYHFAEDSFGLRSFDGTTLFEERELLNRTTVWKTLAFGLSSPDVRKYLLSSADFFLTQCHVDGFRVDAVMYMQSHSYMKANPGLWVSGEDGTAVNVGGVKFLRDLNDLGHRHKNALMISENYEYHHNHYVDTLPTENPLGMGFDLRWNMGASFSTLSALRAPVTQMLALINRFKAATKEKYISAYYSHDESREMNLGSRLLVAGYNDTVMTQRVNLFHALNAFLPQDGRLTFMGADFGATGVWDPTKALPRHLLKNKANRTILAHTAAINKFYVDHPTLWSVGENMRNVNWVDTRGADPVLVYERMDAHKKYLVVHNFSEQLFSPFHIVWRNISEVSKLREVQHVFSSSQPAAAPGVATVVRALESQRPIGVEIGQLAPYGTVVVEELDV